jgi:hypothetical protein
MLQEPEPQLVWRRRTSTAVRQVILSEGVLSMSLRVDEVTVVAVADATASSVPDSCPELELGVHVARLRTAVPTVSDTFRHRSLLSKALAPA